MCNIDIFNVGAVMYNLFRRAYMRFICFCRVETNFFLFFVFCVFFIWHTLLFILFVNAVMLINGLR